MVQHQISPCRVLVQTRTREKGKSREIDFDRFDLISEVEKEREKRRDKYKEANGARGRTASGKEGRCVGGGEGKRIVDEGREGGGGMEEGKGGGQNAD